MESQAISQTPSPTSTPMLSPEALHEKKGKGDETGVVLTATNTMDTLTLNDQATTTADDANEFIQPEFAKTSTLRKILLLSMFTLAEFLDAFNNSALFPAIPIISTDLKFIESETVWIISAYQLTFAAFLLVSGRISDVYTPKPAFIAGALILGFTHLGGGFTHQKIALVVLRALGGIGGALTIPSALSMIVQLFPEPAAQARAIALFGMSGAIGNILGVVIGALLVEHAGWKWIFWFVAIVAVGIGAVCTFLIPNAKRDKNKNVKFDVPGVTILTTAVILFIFAVTSGSTKGWGTAYVLAPLIISLAVAAVFFVWESRIPPEDAVVPPRMWKYRNFGVITGLALLPYFWWVSSFVLVTAWWEQVFGWSAVKTAIHFLPMGVSAFLVAPIAGRLPQFLAHKYILLIALALSIIATILLPFGDSPAHYWRFNFPAFTIGSIGMMIVFANSSIAIFSYTPPAVAGTVGAVFNCALQLGSAVGLAAVSSISTSIDKKQTITPPTTEWPGIINQISQSMWKAAFKGRASAFWFVLAALGVEAIAVLIFFKVDIPVHDEEGKIIEKSDIKRVPEEKETA